MDDVREYMRILSLFMMTCVLDMTATHSSLLLQDAYRYLHKSHIRLKKIVATHKKQSDSKNVPLSRDVCNDVKIFQSIVEQSTELYKKQGKYICDSFIEKINSLSSEVCACVKRGAKVVTSADCTSVYYDQLWKQYTSVMDSMREVITTAEHLGSETLFEVRNALSEKAESIAMQSAHEVQQVEAAGQLKSDMVKKSISFLQSSLEERRLAAVTSIATVARNEGRKQHNNIEKLLQRIISSTTSLQETEQSAVDMFVAKLTQVVVELGSTVQALQEIESRSLLTFEFDISCLVEALQKHDCSMKQEHADICAAVDCFVLTVTEELQLVLARINNLLLAINLVDSVFEAEIERLFSPTGGGYETGPRNVLTLALRAVNELNNGLQAILMAAG